MTFLGLGPKMVYRPPPSTANFYFIHLDQFVLKKHSYDHSWTKLLKLLILISCCARTQCSRMTFRTLTLAFGWNIMWRWNPLCKLIYFLNLQSYLLNSAIIYTRFPPPPSTRKNKQQNICSWQSSTLLMIQTGFSHRNTTTKYFRRRMCPQRSAAAAAGGGGGRDPTVAAEGGAELDGDFSETKISVEPSPGPDASMCLLASMLSDRASVHAAC